MTDSPFGATSTTDDVLAGVDLSGKRALVTGASAGLGLETTRALLASGASVVAAVRDPAKLASRSGELDEARVAGGGDLDTVTVALDDLASVRAAADDVVARFERIDLLIANAGIMACPQGATTDGFETQLGTNHLGHFVFVNRLLPLVLAAAPARVVVLTSAGHRMGDVDLDDPGFERTPYDPWTAYGRAKTANVLFAVELDRRQSDRGVRATAVHPGGIVTELGRHLTKETLSVITEASDSEAIVWKSVPQGAATTVWAGVVADAGAVGGRYCEDCHVAEPVDEFARASGGVLRYAVDPDRARALWTASEAWVGEKFDR